MRLAQLEVLVVDCQATGAHGRLLELGWAVATGEPRAVAGRQVPLPPGGRVTGQPPAPSVGARSESSAPGERVPAQSVAPRVGGAAWGEPLTPAARLIKLPPGERVPTQVARITGINDQLLAGGVSAADAWAELRAAASALPLQPAPAVAHFARFERPFLELLAQGQPTLELVCTHEIARRLLPRLPRRGLRALAGYFGRAVTTLRRSAEHVSATAFVWSALVELLAHEGVETWPRLAQWLTLPVPAAGRARRGWPMPPAVRLALPDRPGLYRMLRTSGDVLYVGKAASLRHRVNSYFRKNKGVHERTLEMLSQARDLSYEVTPSPLEAALLEPDEIKRHRPPYNVALTEAGRELWFATAGLGSRSPRAGGRFEVGPFPSAELLEQFAALTRAEAACLGPARWGPGAELFAAGHRRFDAAHPELRDTASAPHVRLLRVGARLWREGRRDREAAEGPPAEPGAPEWTVELVVTSLERLALRAALALRRARWLTRLVEASLVWSERGAEGARLLVVAEGELAQRATVAPGHEPPLPVGHARSRQERQAGFDLARLDRLRVLTTELKRLAAEGEPAVLRLGPGARFAGPALQRLLEWL